MSSYIAIISNLLIIRKENPDICPLLYPPKKSHRNLQITPLAWQVVRPFLLQTGHSERSTPNQIKR